jgi:hypothetical protein
MSTISVRFWASHHAEKLRIARTYARRVFAFRILAAKYSRNRLAAIGFGAKRAGTPVSVICVGLVRRISVLFTLA